MDSIRTRRRSKSLPKIPVAKRGRSAKSKDLGKTTRAHIRYKAHDADGKEINVPGVTTITGQMNKPFLVGWANRLGLDGIDSQKYTEEAQKIGSAAHEMVEASLQGRDPDLHEFTAGQIERANYGFSEFEKWRSEHEVEVILTETPLVSERFKYGGTLDFYGRVDGLPTLMDFKTSGDLYPEHGWQIGGLSILLNEHRYALKGARLLRIGRSEEEGFDDHVFNGIQVLNARKVFLALLNLYHVKREAGYK
jgi:hypothetical protein